MKEKYGLYTAITIVVANMIGTGIFTSLGFQVTSLSSGFTILLLWLIGGIASLLGALAYAELGGVMPRSGGEYHFLGKLYHPALGFMAGWISFIVGFAAPTAAAAIAFSSYLGSSLSLSFSFLGISDIKLFALLIVLLVTMVHVHSLNTGAAFHNSITTLKILIMLVLIGIGLSMGGNNTTEFKPDHEALQEIISPEFAIALFFVFYSYSGWNAAAYIMGELKDPAKNLTRGLISGTLLVTLLYLATTFIFLYIIPMPEMAGKIEIGYIYGYMTLGLKAGKILGLVMSFLLISTISSLIITGPRVTNVLGEDYKFISWFSVRNSKGSPARAIWIQTLLTVIYILTSSFEQMITYIGFTLNLFTLLTVLGSILHRYRYPKTHRPYRMPLFPVLPAIFILINLWILTYGLIYRPVESIAGLITTAIGFFVWLGIRESKTG